MHNRGYKATFRSQLFRTGGPGGWVFATVPKKHAPGSTEAWGRVPVQATVDGRSWKTSIWREKSGRTLLAVPKRIRDEKDDRDSVKVSVEYDLCYRKGRDPRKR